MIAEMDLLPWYRSGGWTAAEHGRSCGRRSSWWGRINKKREAVPKHGLPPQEQILIYQGRFTNCPYETPENGSGFVYLPKWRPWIGYLLRAPIHSGRIPARRCRTFRILLRLLSAPDHFWPGQYRAFDTMYVCKQRTTPKIQQSYSRQPLPFHASFLQKMTFLPSRYLQFWTKYAKIIKI